ncbi:MAG: hypothetical protein EBU84_12380 [Actinobacteria bacterium]|nr:hypothetical protein [Actinomycetota bacterium]
MAWSYSGDPTTSTRDAVRFLIGDTDTNDQLISNEEINYFVTEFGNARRSASEAARAVAAKFARLMNRSIGGLSADFSAKYRQYLELADNLLSKEEMAPVSLYISGYSRSAKEAVELDTDREPTFSRKGIMDNPRYQPSDESPYDYRRVS